MCDFDDFVDLNIVISFITINNIKKKDELPLILINFEMKSLNDQKNKFWSQ